MKTAADLPEINRTVVKTTETRVLPADSSNDPTNKSLFDYLSRLPVDWGSPPDRHLLYIYRILAETGPSMPIEKCARFMAMPDGSQVELRNREEFEFALFQKYGGGTYRLILKNGPQWVAQERMRFDGPAKNTQPGIFAESGSGPTVTPANSDAGNSDVAKTAMQLVANREGEAVNVAINALRGASDVVQRLSAGGGGGDDVTREFMRVMMARAMNPPDPLESMARMLTVFQTLMTAMNPAAAQNPLVEKIISTALERVVNPPPSGPAMSTGAELVRSLPQIAGFAGDALREWRMGMEAQRDVVMRTGQAPPSLPPGAPGVLPPGAPNPTIMQPPANGAQPVQQNGAHMPGPPLEFIESKIIEILREPLSTAEAAEEVYLFLDRLDQRLSAYLAGLGEKGLTELFQTRTVLQPALQNLPRLQEFIREFLKYSKAASEPITGTEAVTPVKPN